MGCILGVNLAIGRPVKIYQIDIIGELMKALLNSAVLACSLFAVSANATLIEFVDFMGNNQGVEDSFVFDQGGVQLEVTAWTTNVNTAQQQIMPWQQVTEANNGAGTGLYKGSTGFGVISNDVDGRDLDGGESADLNDLDEGILFSFSESVNFLGFAAEDLSSNDDLNFAVVNFIAPGQIQLTDVFIDEPSFFDGYDAFPMFPGIQGRHFMVWVDGNDDDVRVADLAFNRIPEPSTYLLMAVAGAFLVRRRIAS